MSMHSALWFLDYGNGEFSVSSDYGAGTESNIYAGVQESIFTTFENLKKSSQVDPGGLQSNL